MADEKVYEGEYYDGSEAEQAVVRQEHIYPTPMGTGMVKARTGYITSVQNLKPREMDKIERRILKEAALLGEEAFYSWGAGKGRVEGGSIDLAMMMIHAYGNATVVPDQVQETPEAWIFMHVFVDHETTVATPRQWRESKLSVVEGTMDKERKNAIRFGRGQSKNIRNVILHSMPKWLVNKAIEQAKQGARDKLERFIKDKGLAAQPSSIRCSSSPAMASKKSISWKRWGRPRLKAWISTIWSSCRPTSKVLTAARYMRRRCFRSRSHPSNWSISRISSRPRLRVRRRRRRPS